MPNRRVTPLVIFSLCVAGTLLAGCSRPLLSPSEERSPFDRYDAVRGQAEPQYVKDAYNRQRPNLRGRLTPKD